MAIHWIVLDSNPRLDSAAEQYQWLVSDLAAIGDTSKYTIVIFHHPLFDVSKNHENDEKNSGLSCFLFLSVTGYQPFLQGMRMIISGLNITAYILLLRVAEGRICMDRLGLIHICRNSAKHITFAS